MMNIAISMQNSAAPIRHPSILETFLMNKRSVATRCAYKSDLTTLAAFLKIHADDLGAFSRELLDVSIADVVAWRTAMENAKCAPATIARRLAALRTFFTFAMSAGVATSNPALLVETPKVEAALQKAPHLEAHEMKRLLAAPDLATKAGLRDRAILGLLGCSGLRRAEVAALRLCDVRKEPTGLVVTVLGKGGKVRTLDVERATADSLVEYLAADQRALDGSAAPLFKPTMNRRQHGHCEKALSVRAINVIVAKYGNGDDGRVAPHALRRAFATTAIDRGASLEALRRTLGHSDMKTTARYDRRRQSTLTVSY